MKDTVSVPYIISWAAVGVEYFCASPTPSPLYAVMLFSNVNSAVHS